jgi:predicted nucleotidyltransferase
VTVREDSFVAPIADRLSRIDGVVAVALGGSRATGTQHAESDYDIGVYYRDAAPFLIADIVTLAEELSDEPDPVVTTFYRWGRWVNGGAWFTANGQWVNFLYRNLDQIERVIDNCCEGRFESDFYQQPPYGFHSYIYLAELSICRPLHDPQAVLAALKQRIAVYPPALKATIINRFLWGAEFDLQNARKYCERGDVYAACGCFSRIAASLVQIVYALNERYFITDKGALGQAEGFDRTPPDFRSVLERVLARPGASAAELGGSLLVLAELHQRLADLCGDLYSRPNFRASSDA